MLFVVITGLMATSDVALAASLSLKDLQVLGRALAFTQPPPTGRPVVAIVYDPGSEASRHDAEAIAAQMGDGLRVGAATFQPRLLDTMSLAAGGYAAIVAAAGAQGDRVMAASRAAHVLCVTGDFAAVLAGQCTMAIRAEPRVEVVVNHAAAADAKVDFAAAFRMMIREI